MIIKKDPDAIRSYLEDASNLKGGYASEVFFPESQEEISGLMAECNARKVPVTLSAGGTGTTGGRIPFGGVVVSMEKLNRILDISVEKKYVGLQAGVMVDDLKKICDQNGLFYTSHPTEKTALVGGTISTNASGARSLKYGSIRAYVKSLKMVLADGEVLRLERGKRFITPKDNILKLTCGRNITIPFPGYKMPDVKNSAGYFIKDGADLIDLFIGQEGTLSIITEIELAMVKKPEKLLSALAFFKREEDAWNFSDQASCAIDALSIEYLDANSLDLLRGKNHKIPNNMKAAVFFEQESVDADEDALWKVWVGLISKHNVSMDDTWVAMNSKEAEYFLELRHCLPETINDLVRARGFAKLSTDIAVPRKNFREMMIFYRDIYKKSKIEHVIFGHIGECHVHTNLLVASQQELALGKDICFEIINKCVSLGGTVTAEHGVGKTKHKYLELMYGRQGIIDMARIKKAFDPRCILGKGNIFSQEILDLA